MLTYQDLLQVPERDLERANFVKRVIGEYRDGETYKNAVVAEDYDKCRNTTIMQYQKLITLVNGQVVPDQWSATHRSTSNFFGIYTSQISQYLLGNGVHWQDDHDDKLGKDFDVKLQQIGHDALCGGVAYGFYDLNRVVVFTALDFAPLYDEETGKLMAGVRFWQLASDKPLRATLYEPDGYTQFLWSKNDQDKTWQKMDADAYFQPRKPYSWISIGDAKDREDGTETVANGEPTKGFPIVPMYSNRYHQSDLVGHREKIDAYDFILNGYEDDLDNAQLFWVISQAGGMDDVDLQQFLDRLKTVKAAAPMDGQQVTPVTVDIPYNARITLLNLLSQQIYRDLMILNPDDIAAGATTATQIRAAYERQNVRADEFEYCVLEFLYRLMELAGIDDEPSFTRSTIVNVAEEVQTVLQTAQVLPAEYVVQKVLSILGDGDKAEEIIKQIQADDFERLN